MTMWGTITALPLFKKNIHTIRASAKRLIVTFFIFVILLGVSYVILSPMFRVISNAIRSYQDTYNPLVYMIPINPTWENLYYAYFYMNYWHTLFYTLGFCLLITLLQVLVCSLTGYGFARFRFPGRAFLFGLMIFTIVFPIETIMTPLYVQFRFFDVLGIIKMVTGAPLNLMNSWWPLILMTTFGMGLNAGLYIYIFRQFFRGLPKELEEAALIDGAGTLRTFATVMLPNAMPAAITVTMFSMVWQYNDTFFASLFMSGKPFIARNMVTLGHTFSTAITWIFKDYSAGADSQQVVLVTNAGVVLGILPILLLYFVLQRYFMEGIERSGIVG